jgi:hypothetical protein
MFTNGSVPFTPAKTGVCFTTGITGLRETGEKEKSRRYKRQESRRQEMRTGKEEAGRRKEEGGNA